MSETGRNLPGKRPPESERAHRGDRTSAGGGDLEPATRSQGGCAALEVGVEVLITGGIFEGHTGVIEDHLPSGKVRVAVETRRSQASARVDPAHLEPLGILVEGAIEEAEEVGLPLVAGLERWEEERDGSPTEEALRARIEARGFCATRYVYPPGTYFPEHTHPVDKIDAVVSGRFRMTVEGAEVILEAGDSLAVPRETVHSAEVVGDAPVVSLDAIRDEGGRN